MATHPLIARRQTMVAFVFTLAFLCGVSAGLDSGRSVELLLSLLMGVAVTHLCIVDSQIRGKPLVRSFHWLILLTWTVSVPVYLILTRGWRRLHWVMLWIGGYLLAFLLGCYLVSFVTPPLE